MALKNFNRRTILKRAAAKEDIARKLNANGPNAGWYIAGERSLTQVFVAARSGIILCLKTQRKGMVKNDL